MENAAKAINIAVGVIIGILILSVFIYIFSKGGSFLEKIDDRKNSEAIQAYNSKLDIYNKSGSESDYNTIYDVVTACNLAYDINKDNNYDSKNCLEIEIKIDTDTTYILENIDTVIKGCIKKDSTNDTKLTHLITTYSDVSETADEAGNILLYNNKFSGEVSYNDEGKINKIIFEKK